MADYKIREVKTRKDLRRFVRFPDELYAGCEQYVPFLHKGQEDAVSRSVALEFCSAKQWMVEADGKVVGRIGAFINRRYNEKYGVKRAGFGWFDSINDIEVARLLFSTAETWAKENGMDEIHGPLYYNTLGRQGMLVEGFDKLAPFTCLYNYPYYVDLVSALGFEKECDWVQYRMPADQDVPEKMHSIASRLLERYRIRVADFDALKKDKEMVHNFFRMYNEAFDGTVYNFVPFTDAEIEEKMKELMGQLDGRLCCVLLDENDDVAAFGIALPSLSKAMRKVRGSLFPFGWWHLLKARNDFEEVELMLAGAAPKWQNTGISSVFHCMMADQFKACGARWAIANPQLEFNTVINVWERYEHELWLRRRCWIKKIK